MNAYVCMKQVGEKRNMSALEKKVDALLLYCTADTEEEKEIYYKGLCRLVLGPYPEAQHSRRMQIDRFLKDMGIRDNLLGYEYLQTAIELAVMDLEQRYGISVRCKPVEEIPEMDEITDMQISFLDILSLRFPCNAPYAA